MSGIIRREIPFEVKQISISNEFGAIEGYGTVFGVVDYDGDMIQKGAFENSLKEWESKSQLPQMLGFHDRKNPVGDWSEVYEDENGLRVKGNLWVVGEFSIPASKTLYNMCKGTGPKGLSIGFYAKQFNYQEQADGNVVRVITEADLVEISIVGRGANKMSQVDTVKNRKDLPTKRQVEEVLRESGFSTKQALTFISKGYNAVIDDNHSKKGRDDQDQSGGVKQHLTQLLKRMES